MTDNNPNAMNPDDLDDLLAELGKSSAPAPGAAKGPGQDEIDALLSEIGGTPAAVPGMNIQAGEPTSAEVDELLAGLGQATGRIVDPNAVTMADTQIGQGDIDALLNQISDTAEGRGTRRLSTDQSKRLDAVLEHIQTPAATGQGSSLGLTTDELEDLVAKHAPGPDSPAVTESMISQDDIDDLVAQLTAVVGGTGPIAAAEAVTGSISRTVDVSIAPATQSPANKPTTAKSAGSPNPGTPRATPKTSPARTTPAHGGAHADIPVAMVGGGMMVGVLAPAEVRGARWLLLAAVVLLAVCAAGMGAMVKTLAGLSQQLTRNDPTDAVDADRFALALTAARNQLASGDAIDMSTGIQALERLKENHPERAQELTLEIARHYRIQGSHRKAAEAYATIVDNVLKGGDPRILLEYVHSLAALNENDEGIRLLYDLLSREQSWLARQDALGHPKPADDLARDRAAIQKAYLLLGELLARERDPSRSAGNNSMANASVPSEPMKGTP